MSIVAAYAVPHPPLIVPSVGHGEERAIGKTIDAYREVARRIAIHAPDVIILTSPHAPAYRDAFALAPGPRLHGSLADFGVAGEQMDWGIDCDVTAEAVDSAQRDGIPLFSRIWGDRPMDHASFVPLFFVEQAGFTCPLTVCGVSGCSDSKHFAAGKTLAYAADALGRRAVFIASGDLSHRLKPDGPYGFAPEGPMLDAALCEAFSRKGLKALFDLDPVMRERGAECGVRSFMMMAGALDGCEYTGELLSYEGPFGVGYGVAAFETGNSHF